MESRAVLCEVHRWSPPVLEGGICSMTVGCLHARYRVDLTAAARFSWSHPLLVLRPVGNNQECRDLQQTRAMSRFGICTWHDHLANIFYWRGGMTEDEYTLEFVKNVGGTWCFVCRGGALLYFFFFFFFNSHMKSETDDLTRSSLWTLSGSTLQVVFYKYLLNVLHRNLVLNGVLSWRRKMIAWQRTKGESKQLFWIGILRARWLSSVRQPQKPPTSHRASFFSCFVSWQSRSSCYWTRRLILLL